MIRRAVHALNRLIPTHRPDTRERHWYVHQPLSGPTRWHELDHDPRSER